MSGVENNLFSNTKWWPMPPFEAEINIKVDQILKILISVV